MQKSFPANTIDIEINELNITDERNRLLLVTISIQWK